MLEFKIPIEPRPMPRPRFANGRTYTPQEFVDYKEQVKASAVKAMDGVQPLKGELKCVMRFFRKFNRSSRRFGDCDNLFKAVADALNGICYEDDSQIVVASVEKHVDKENPRVEVALTNANNFGSDKN